jgi:glycosyltransferase involved in cell wall biosynthesis
MPRPFRITNVITRMNVGGAQETVYLTCALIDQQRYPSGILCGAQTGGGETLIAATRERGIPLRIEPSLVRELNPIMDPLAVARLTAIFRRDRPDIVHTHSSKAGIVGRVAARLAGVRHVVHSAHGWAFNQHQSGLERSLYQTLERSVGALTDVIVLVAQANLEAARELGIGRPERYRIIRSGIEVERFARKPGDRASVCAEFGLDPACFLIGSVARLSPPKEPYLLVEALARIAPSHPSAALLLVGEGEHRARTEAAIARHGLQDRVRLAGLRNDVPRLLGACDAFALATLWEGLPRVLPQALAAGLPIVSSAVNGTVEAVIDGVTGYLVPPGDVAAMADRLCRLACDPAAARRMGEAGRLRVDEFSARQMVRRLEELYEELMAGDARP